MLEHRRLALGGQLPRLGGAHGVDRLGQVGHDVEAVEHVHGVAGTLGDHREVGPPHVGADEAQGGAAGGAEPVEEPVERRGPAFPADPQQSPAMVVDLVDEGQVALPATAGEFVDADGLDVGEVAVGESPSTAVRTAR